jgi:hypothetical protein
MSRKPIHLREPGVMAPGVVCATGPCQVPSPITHITLTAPSGPTNTASSWSATGVAQPRWQALYLLPTTTGSSNLTFPNSRSWSAQRTELLPNETGSGAIRQ